MISDSKKFIFIHIPRTAGTSITWALREYSRYPIIQKGRGDNVKPNHKYTKHYPLTQVIKTGKFDKCNLTTPMVPEDELDDYYIFTIVRNPWDRMVSLVRFNGGTIRTRTPSSMYKQLEHPKGGLKLDYIIRYENLEYGFAEVCEELDIPIVELGQRNKTNHDHYSTYYKTEEDVEFIRNKYKIDVDTFNYEFERIDE